MKKIKLWFSSPILIRIITIGLNFVSNIIINRSLGIALKGQYTTIFNYANFLQLFLNFGICYAYPIMKREKNADYAKKSIMTIIWLQTIFLFLMSLIIIGIWHSINLIIIILLGITLVCNSQVVFIALIDDIKERNYILLLSTIIFIVLNIVLVLSFRGNLYAVVVIQIIKYILEIIIISSRYYYWVFDLSLLDINLFKQVLEIGIPTAIMVILISCNYNIDIFLLEWMKSGSVQVGMYGVAYTLTNMLWVIPDAFKELIYNRSAKEDDHKFILKCIVVNMIICICILVGFSLLGKWFLNFVYGKEYVVAYNVTLTLFVGIIPMIAYKLIHPIYVNKGKSLVVTIFLGISVIVNICISSILIPKYNAFGAAMATVISYTVCGVLFMAKYCFDFIYKSDKQL